MHDWNLGGMEKYYSNNMDPGNYTVYPVPMGQGNDHYRNYSISYVPGLYTVIGATYELEAIAAPYSDQSGSRPVGTVGISNASGGFAYYTAGTTVLLYATPQPGYEVDTWTATFDNDTVKTQSGGTTYVLTTEAQPVTVTVTFKPALLRLYVVAQPAEGGVVTCADEYFSSGAYASYGAEYTFTAAPKAGYHFSQWQVVAEGKTTVFAGTPGEDGSNSLSVTVGSSSMTVYALFERDSYTLSLEGDIIAFYMYDHDNDPSSEPVKRTIVSGAAVPGDTEITVVPKVGYQAAEDAFFIVNGEVTDEKDSYIFRITMPTVISLDTVRNRYSVELALQNGSLAVTINGTPATEADLASVEGGSQLVFTARADRGYMFAKWLVNGDEVVDPAGRLTISELGSNVEVEAVFVPNIPYTVRAAVNDPNRGAMVYTLYDIYGDLVAEKVPLPEEGLTAYAGESLTLSVLVNPGSMVEQWKVGQSFVYTTDKNYTIDRVSGDLEATVYLKAASLYKVYFSAVGGVGSSLAAKADGVEIVSGDLQYGGSTLEFSAYPASEYMLDYWTVNEQVVVDDNGRHFIEPKLAINPLKNETVVNAYFTTAVMHRIELQGTGDMGDSVITYVTPVSADDDGMRNDETADVRDGGTLVMKFAPNSVAQYATDVEFLRNALEAKLTEASSTVTVEEVDDNGDIYFVATIDNVKEGLILTDEELFYPVYSITVPEGVTASVAATKEGVTVTLTVKPPAKHQLGALTVSEKGGTGIVPLNETVSPELLEYTFTMPAYDVEVIAEFHWVYEITVPQGVTAVPALAMAGTEVTLMVTPAPNYKLVSLAVKDSADNLVALKEEVTADVLTYTFDMPAADVEVSVQFRYVPPYIPAPDPVTPTPDPVTPGPGDSQPAPQTESTTTDAGLTAYEVRATGALLADIVSTKAKGETSYALDIEGALPEEAEMDLLTVTIPENVVRSLAGLELVTDTPYGSLGLPQDLVRALAEAGQEISLTMQRVGAESVLDKLGDNDQLLGEPLDITTDLQGVQVRLACNVALPNDPAEREAYLANLYVLAIHGEDDVERITALSFEIDEETNTLVAISFHAERFSTFALVAAGVAEPSYPSYLYTIIDSTSYVLDGENRSFDNLTAYRANDNTTVMAIRLLQELGAKIDYRRVGGVGVVTVAYGDITATLQEKSTVMTVTDSSGTRQVTLRTVFTNKDGRTYLPTRDVTENLGFLVHWQAKDDSITIKVR